MSDKDLMPCPFCGGRAEFVCNEPIEGAGFVECYDCTARGPISKQRQAVDAWNTRAERACTVELRNSACGGVTFHCSECGADLGCDTRNKQRYCPNCGARVAGQQ